VLSKKSRTSHSRSQTTAPKPSRAVKSAESKLREEIASKAKEYIGIPYNYGGKTPKAGFDCSGFSNYIYNLAGVQTSGSSSQLSILGKKRSDNSIKKGDLAFFGTGDKVSHVAIVLDKSKETFKVIHATSSKGVVISNVYQSQYWKDRFLYGRDIISENGYGTYTMVN
jgi:cell wall-associated NlpC family hydrolase